MVVLLLLVRYHLYSITFSLYSNSSVSYDAVFNKMGSEGFEQLIKRIVEQLNKQA